MAQNKEDLKTFEKKDEQDLKNLEKKNEEELKKFEKIIETKELLTVLHFKLKKKEVCIKRLVIQQE